MDPLILMAFALTGSICGVLIFVGALLTIPGERCSRYWIAGTIMGALGYGVIVQLRNSTGFIGPTIGFALVGMAFILAWWGFQAFFQKRPRKTGWIIAGVFIAAYALLQLLDTNLSLRFALISAMAILTWSLCLREMIVHKPARLRFAEYIAISSLVILITNNVIRMVTCLHVVFTMGVGIDADSTAALMAHAPTLEVAFIIYIVPMIGTLLFPIAVTLLYFNRLIDHANHVATHDELTGLLNRRAIVALGEREIQLAEKLALPLTVAFIDIDFFKKINDRFGHDKGDMVLRDVAQILVRICRPDDLLGRYGGEEFCAIFPGDDYAGAQVVGERLVTAMRQHHFDDMPPVTISVGLAVLDPGDPQRNWHVLVNRADVELYQAKQNGRDQYRIHRVNVSMEKTAGARSAIPQGSDA